VARVRIEWSVEALADLDRFAAFLAELYPRLAPVVAEAIIRKTDVLAEFPELGRPDPHRAEYQQVVLRVLNASYVFQYRYDGERLVMLRVFHGREDWSAGEPRQ
jgi:plasmid stabilization system protein ParE